MSSLLEDASLWTWVPLTMVFAIYRWASGSDVGTGDAAKEVCTGGSSGDGAAGSAGAGGANFDGNAGSDGCFKFCSGTLCVSGAFCMQNGDGA